MHLRDSLSTPHDPAARDILKTMRIAVIGGGFTGLTAAYELGKVGHEVTVFEKEKTLGGLAHGFKQKNWDWHLEGAYHHLFTNDNAIINLVKELGLEKKLIIKRPITATLMSEDVHAESQQNFAGLHFASADEYRITDSDDSREKLKARLNFRWRPKHAQIYQLDSPQNLLAFPYLSPVDKLRTASLLAFLKLNPFWQPLENVTAEKFFKTIGGKKAWEVLWEPLMRGKFGEYAPTIAASWLWARIKKRTPSLYYIDGGFQTLVHTLEKEIKLLDGTIRTGTSIATLAPLAKFDKILLTIPTPIAMKLVNLPSSYTKPLLKIPHLHAQTLILETKEPILKNTYWLNINDRSFPFLAVVAHTNFMDKKHYGGHHLTYFGNYLPTGHPYLSMTKDQLLKVFLPYIKRLNSPFNNWQLVNSFSFVGPFAQPVHQLHYSKIAPTIQTPIPNIYLANLDSIYPWDRGTNYAVELGQRAAKVINSDE